MDNSINKDLLISRLRSLSAEIGAVQSNEPVREEFGSVLKQAVKSVSDQQLNASSVAEKFEYGDANVSLSDVMIEIQKARVSFEALSQVRNRFVTAYQQVMSMPL